LVPLLSSSVQRRGGRDSGGVSGQNGTESTADLSLANRVFFEKVATLGAIQATE
jgi:hypothetical protein